MKLNKCIEKSKNFYSIQFLSSGLYKSSSNILQININVYIEYYKNLIIFCYYKNEDRIYYEEYQ